MLKQHQELLEQVQKAEAMARALYAKGARGLEDKIQRLRLVAGDLQARIRHYESAAKKAPVATTAAKTETENETTKPK